MKVLGLALAGALLLSGCSATQAISNLQEGQEAVKSYIDEKADRREALRRKSYQIEDAIISGYVRQAQQHMSKGETKKATEKYEKALGRIETYYPELEDAAKDIRETLNALTD